MATMGQGRPRGQGTGQAVVAACEKPSNFSFSTPTPCDQGKRSRTIGKKVYLRQRDLRPKCEKQIAAYEAGRASHCHLHGQTHLRCRTTRPSRRAPGFNVPAAKFAPRPAGLLYPLLGAMRTMPGLPSRPAFFDVDLDDRQRRGHVLTRQKGDHRDAEAQRAWRGFGRNQRIAANYANYAKILCVIQRIDC